MMHCMVQACHMYIGSFTEMRLCHTSTQAAAIYAMALASGSGIRGNECMPLRGTIWLVLNLVCREVDESGSETFSLFSTCVLQV